ncbi:MAG: haloacid dehalogenase-like hydrolase [Lachnospiraceae bacterium]|nr:haloacid dehalogenase-like hydrolase [Lachnospiraceae bacterium]
MEKPVIAIMYDFDKTLCTTNMQEYSFIPEIGLTADEFWSQSNELAQDEQMDPVLSYLYLMLTESRNHRKSIRRENFVKAGEKLQFYPGVKTWFDRINQYGEEHGVSIEHYIISSGLKEIIEGCEIKDAFKEIFACEFLYDENGVAVWPKNVVNYTTKTQILFRINKGVMDLSDDRTVNEFTPENQRRVPFHNMIYIADGVTDVPCMKLVKVNGGYSVAVYQEENEKSKDTVKELMRQDRINLFAPADYSQGAPLESCIKQIIDRMQANDLLLDIYEKQKAEIQ